MTPKGVGTHRLRTTALAPGNWTLSEILTHGLITMRAFWLFFLSVHPLVYWQLALASFGH